MLVVLIGVFSTIAIYNNLVALKNQVKNAWAQIDVQLKRRHDLIPNLVETIKGYAKHEKETLEGVIEARSRALGAGSVEEKAKAESGLSSAISRLLLLVENYPDIKANRNFQSLQEELTSTENKIAFARQSYNDQVYFLNNKIQMFPSNIIAGFFKFTEEKMFELEDKTEREAPKVSFS